MKLINLLYILVTSSFCFGQLTSAEVQSIRIEHLKELKDVEKGILKADEIKDFGGLNYFDFDSTYQLTAIFSKDKGPKFEMPTSTDRKPIYRQYGNLSFELNGQKSTLVVYQNIELSKSKEYRNYLFVPFRDNNSGNETYGGGRYLDIEKQKGKSWLIDFNLAYNPYCAYSYRYSCPIPPKENTLTITIDAGEKVPLGH